MKMDVDMPVMAYLLCGKHVAVYFLKRFGAALLQPYFILNDANRYSI